MDQFQIMKSCVQIKVDGIVILGYFPDIMLSPKHPARYSPYTGLPDHETISPSSPSRSETMARNGSMTKRCQKLWIQLNLELSVRCNTRFHSPERNRKEWSHYSHYKKCNESYA